MTHIFYPFLKIYSSVRSLVYRLGAELLSATDRQHSLLVLVFSWNLVTIRKIENKVTLILYEPQQKVLVMW